MFRRVMQLAGIQLLVGVVIVLVVFVATGHSIYAGLGWTTSAPRGNARPVITVLLHMPVVAIMYCVREWMLALIEGLVLAALIRWQASRMTVVAVGVTVALAFEVLVKLPLRHGWLASLAAWIRPDLQWAEPWHHPSRAWHQFIEYGHPILLASLAVSLYAAFVLRRPSAEAELAARPRQDSPS